MKTGLFLLACKYGGHLACDCMQRKAGLQGSQVPRRPASSAALTAAARPLSFRPLARTKRSRGTTVVTSLAGTMLLEITRAQGPPGRADLAGPTLHDGAQDGRGIRPQAARALRARWPGPPEPRFQRLKLLIQALDAQIAAHRGPNLTSDDTNYVNSGWQFIMPRTALMCSRSGAIERLRRCTQLPPAQSRSDRRRTTGTEVATLDVGPRLSAVAATG